MESLEPLLCRGHIQSAQRENLRRAKKERTKRSGASDQSKRLGSSTTAMDSLETSAPVGRIDGRAPPRYPPFPSSSSHNLDLQKSRTRAFRPTFILYVPR